jgi:hypothetical protein
MQKPWMAMDVSRQYKTKNPRSLYEEGGLLYFLELLET